MRRRHTSAELKVVRRRLAVMGRYKYKKIREITGISEREQSGVYELFMMHGRYSTKEDSRWLTLEFLEGCIEQQARFDEYLFCIL